MAGTSILFYLPFNSLTSNRCLINSEWQSKRLAWSSLIKKEYLQTAFADLEHQAGEEAVNCTMQRTLMTHTYKV